MIQFADFRRDFQQRLLAQVERGFAAGAVFLDFLNDVQGCFHAGNHSITNRFIMNSSLYHSLEKDRDLNAAKNILQQVLRVAIRTQSEWKQLNLF